MIKEPRILILDDHTLFLKGMEHELTKLLGTCKFSAFNSIADLEKAKVDFDTFDLFISDLELPDEDIFFLLKNVRARSRVPILIISMHYKIVSINQCVDLGVNGYLLKNDDAYLKVAIERLLEGRKFFSPRVNDLISNSIAQNIKFSEREIEVIKLLGGGANNKLIAETLFISVETVKTYKRNIKVKLGLESAQEIVSYVKENMIV